MIDEDVLELINQDITPTLSYIDQYGFPVSMEVKSKLLGGNLEILEIPLIDNSVTNHTLTFDLNDKNSSILSEYAKFVRLTGNIIRQNKKNIFEIDIIEKSLVKPKIEDKVQQSITNVVNHLKDYNKQLVDKIVFNSNNAISIVNYGGISTTTSITLVSNSNRELFFIGSINSKQMIKLNYSSNIRLIFPGKSKYYQLDGFVEKVNYKNYQNEYQKLLQLTGEINKNSVLELVKITPLKFTYGSQSNLEVFDFNIITSKKYMIKSVNNQLKYWMNVIRGPLLLASIIPVLLGSSIAKWQGYSMNYLYLLLAIIGLVSIQGGANLINDYFDHKSENDDLNLQASPFYSGPRYIQLELASAIKILIMGIFFMTIGIIIGLYLNYRTQGNIILYFGLIGVILAYFYSGEPLKLSYRYFGDIILIITFGPLPVMGSYYLQTNNIWINNALITISIPVGMLIAIISFMSNFQTIEIDKLSGKNNLTSRIGKNNSLKLYHILTFIVYTWILIASILEIIPILSIVTLFLLPISIVGIHRIFNKELTEQSFESMYKLLFIIYVTFGITLCAILLNII